MALVGQEGSKGGKLVFNVVKFGKVKQGSYEGLTKCNVNLNYRS